MIEELNTAAKKAGLEIIDMSAAHANEMETWADVLARNPGSATAPISAGFVSKPTKGSRFEFVTDVQAPPEQGAVLRTWAIETKIGDNQKEYFNNIQLTFQADGDRVHGLIAKGKPVSRDDIRLVLQNETTRLARITVSNDFGSDGIKLGHGERYDFTTEELSQSQDITAKVSHTLQAVLEAF